MRAILYGVVLTFGLGCSVSMMSPEAAGPMPAGSSAIAPGSDPICGEGERWNGAKCVHAGGTELSRPTTAQKLDITDVVEGNGAQARPGDTVTVHYVGSLEDGTKFDSSRDRGQPFEFKIGSGQIIKGFERGVVGMKVGGVRRLVIPPDLAYGRKGQPPVIPPNATLMFEIELIGVK
jgi:FKBP-type peptidyl-prolyl cis-trans isomerase